MSVKSHVESTIKVSAPNCLEMKPGGYYNLNEDNDIEKRVVQLHLLQHHIDLMIADICASSENRVKTGTEIEKLAEQLFGNYQAAVVLGIDVFSTDNYYVKEVHALRTKLTQVKETLNEWLRCCDNAIESSYLDSLISILNRGDIAGYRNLHKKLDDYEKDYNTLLYWKKDTEL